MTRLPRIAVIIASKGRPDDLALWLDHVARQTYPPAMMIWSVPSEQDVPVAALASLAPDQCPIIRYAPVGLTCQRNAGLDVLPPEIDVVAFFDDDFIPADDCLQAMADLFAFHPSVVGLTGHVLADGINGAGVSVEEARAYIAQHHPVPVERAKLRRTVGLYGCNMAMRCSAIGTQRFDENLPLYGWQEDVDFAQRLRARGPIYRTDGFAGVHRGAKGGRVSGRRLGYSQVANILYLIRKGSMPRLFGWQLMLRNILANHVLIARPEPWVDRRGRAMGNWLAFRDLIGGSLHPLRALEV